MSKLVDQIQIYYLINKDKVHVKAVQNNLVIFIKIKNVHKPQQSNKKKLFKISKSLKVGLQILK